MVKKDTHLHIRANSGDLKRWRQRAKVWDVPLSVFVVRALNYCDRFGVNIGDIAVGAPLQKRAAK